MKLASREKETAYYCHLSGDYP